MPMILFNPQPGRVKRVITNQNHVPAIIAFRELNYTTYQVIVTGVNMQTNPKYQATESLGGDVLLVSFGESLGPMQISGLLFEQTCETLGSDGGGVYRLLSWWDSQNVTTRTTPIEIILGNRGILRVFLGAMQINLQNPKDRIWQFSMNLMRIPRKRSVDDDRFASIDGPSDTLPNDDEPANAPPNLTPIQIARSPLFAAQYPVSSLLSDGTFSDYFVSGVKPEGYDDPDLGLENPIS